MSERIYPAIILNEPYISYVKDGRKIIETRMRLLTQLVGDVIFCCDKGISVNSPNAGKAVCLVRVAPGRTMTIEDEKGACITCVPNRKAYDLTDLRHFSYDFSVKDYAIPEPGKRNPNWQGIFKIRIPDFVEIISPNKQQP